MNLILSVMLAIRLTGTITHATEVDIREQLDRHKGGRIHLLINSGGGNVEVGYRIMDMLRKTNKPIDCVIVGSAESAAFTLLDVCTNRYTTATSTFLVHEVRLAYQGVVVTEKELRKDLERLVQENRKMKAIVKRMLGKYEKGTWTGRRMSIVYPKWIRVVDSIDWIQ